MLVMLLVFLNLMISAFNAYSCGRAWPESKRIGGWTRFMAWMGAIMSAVGFTWCYLVIAVMVAVSQQALTPEQAQAAFDLGYLALIVPCIGSGTAITINSWMEFRRTRSLGDGAVALYNTAADLHNIYGAVQHTPSAWKSASKLFESKDRDSNAVVFMLVACVALAGVLTTALIIHLVAQKREMELRLAALA